LLEGVLAEYGVRGSIDQIRPGPVVTLYELVPVAGVKHARVVALSDDIARSMGVAACRIAVVSGRNAIGIELPNARRETVYLRDLLSSPDYERSQGVPMALGETIGGEPYIADLSKMPHLLIAGTTGSGKSVGVNAMILSILYRLSPEECRFIMIDPKMLELSVYDRIPHLLAPVVTEPPKAIGALKWTVKEMERRYRAMSQLGVRNIGGYNDKVQDAQRRGEVLTRRVQTGFDPETGKPVFEDQPLALAPLPFAVRWIDPRPDWFPAAAPANAQPVATADPVAELDAAPPGAFIVVMTHSHPLDLDIVARALQLGHFPYVGLIGSATKRARFESRLRDLGVEAERIAGLVCPIGAPRVRDKTPAVIAATVAAELLQKRDIC
jgi:hypothetical protein